MAAPIAEVAAVVCSTWSVDQLSDFFDSLACREQAKFVRDNELDGMAFCEIVALDGFADMSITSKVQVGKIQGRLRQLAAASLQASPGEPHSFASVDSGPWEEVVEDAGVRGGSYRIIDVAKAPLSELQSSVAARRRARLLTDVCEDALATGCHTLPSNLRIHPFTLTEQERALPNRGFVSAIGLAMNEIHDGPRFQTFPLTEFAGASIVVDLQDCGSKYYPGVQLRLRIASIRQDCFARAAKELTTEGRIAVSKGEEGMVIKPSAAGQVDGQRVSIQFPYTRRMLVLKDQIEAEVVLPSTGEAPIREGSTYQVVGGCITFERAGRTSTYFVGSPPMEATPGVLVPWRVAFAGKGEDDILKVDKPTSVRMLAKLQLSFINARTNSKNRTTKQVATGSRKRAKPDTSEHA